MANQPDLVIGDVTIDLTIAQYSDVTFSYVVQNVGAAATTTSTWAVYAFDKQPVFITGGFAGAESVGTLAAGASTTITETFAANLSLGQHTVWIKADTTNKQAEADETNNLKSITFTVTQALRPDLVVESVTGDTSVPQGYDLDFSYVVKNIGVKPIGGSITRYQFDDKPTSSVNSGPGDSVGALAEGESAPVTSHISTAGLSAGQHTLWIGADAGGSLAEIDETNNWTPYTFTVTPNLPDLIIESITGPTEVFQGGDLHFSYVLKDANSANILPSLNSSIIFGIDRQPTSSDNDWSAGSGDLPGGGSLTFNEVLVATHLSVGQHTLWIKADGSNQVAEGNEANNLKSFTFTVTAPVVRPDLQLTSINGATSVTQGDTLNISYLVKNVGSMASIASHAGYMMEQKADATHYQGATVINALGVNEGQWLNAAIDTSSLSPGLHTAYIAVDLFDTVTELTETNNWGGLTFLVTAAVRPDMVVGSITAGTSVVQGADFNFSYLVQNSGNAPSGASWSGFRIDQQPDQSNSAGFNSTNGLAAGGSQTLSNSFNTANLSVGQHTLYVMADYWGQQVVESNESNNVRSITFTVTAPPLSDLAVGGITAGASVVQGAAFNFSYVIQNAGAAASGANWAGFMVDHAVDPTHYAGFSQVNTLAVNDTQTLTGSINTSGLSVGTHTLYVAADYWGNMVGEGNEANNTLSMTFNVTAPPQADLAVSSITAPASVMQGNDFNFSYLIANNGTASAGTSWSGVWLDQQPDAGSAIGFNSTSGLSVGGTQSLGNTIHTSGLSVGTHTLWIAADYWGNQVSESNEGNNWRSVTFDVTAPVPADLTVTGITPAAASVVKGQHLDFSYVVKNIAAGLASGSNWAGFRIDGQPDSTHFDGFNFVGALAADGTQTLSNSVDTSNLSVGTHTLYVAADYWGNMVSEGNEANNVLSVTFDVTAPPQADLAVSSITPSAASVVKGQHLDFSYVVANGGAAASGSNWAGFMIDQQPDASHYVGFNMTDSLGVGSSQTLSNSVDTSSLSVGTHTLYVAADYWGNMVGEGNEANNVLSVTFDVTAPPQADLAVSSITAGATVMQGLAFNFSYVVGNIGTASSGTNWAGFMIDQQPDASHYVGFGMTNALSAGGSQTLSGSVNTSGLSVGTHTLYVAADYWGNMVGEGNEANNGRSVTFDVAAPVQPDLTVASITPASSSVVKGQSFDFSFAIQNSAAGLPAGQSWAGIMVDQAADQTHYVAYNATSALAPGASQTFSNSIDTSNLSVGTHTLHVTADYWNNMVGEADEANNDLSVTFTVTDPSHIV